MKNTHIGDITRTDIVQNLSRIHPLIVLYCLLEKHLAAVSLPWERT